MPRARGRPVAVHRDALIAATLHIIDAEGIDALTMRRLATELGVSPMAAYRHFGSKDELLRAAAASVVADIDAVPTGIPWQEGLRLFFEAFHDRLLQRPGVARLFGGQTFLSETVYAVSDPVFASLIEAGFSPENAVSLFMACATCSIGAATLEAAEAHQSTAASAAPAILLSAEKYPGIAAVLGYLPDRQSSASHSIALRNLIFGYARALERPD